MSRMSEQARHAEASWSQEWAVQADDAVLVEDWGEETAEERCPWEMIGEEPRTGEHHRSWCGLCVFVQEILEVVMLR